MSRISVYLYLKYEIGIILFFIQELVENCWKWVFIFSIADNIEPKQMFYFSWLLYFPSNSVRLLSECNLGVHSNNRIWMCFILTNLYGFYSPKGFPTAEQINISFTFSKSIVFYSKCEVPSVWVNQQKWTFPRFFWISSLEK